MMSKIIYLAARYTRRLELCGYAEELRAMGYVVDARWLLGEHQIHDSALTVESATDTIPPDGLAFARDDVDDVVKSDILISFTEMPRSGHSRGGRHVEFGLALGMNLAVWWQRKRLIVVGPRENVFHCLPSVDVYPTWKKCKEALND